MPPPALISLTASLTPLSKFVPDVAPVPDGSTNPTIRTGACCAKDGSAAISIHRATERQENIFMNSSIQQLNVLGCPARERANTVRPPVRRASRLAQRSVPHHAIARLSFTRQAS